MIAKAPQGDAILEFTFRNRFGESWTLRIDRDAEAGELTGDELGDAAVPIVDDTNQSDLILNDDEASWLAECWKTVTGRRLWTNSFQQVLALISQLPNQNEEG